MLLPKLKKYVLDLKEKNENNRTHYKEAASQSNDSQESSENDQEITGLIQQAIKQLEA